ncbi:GNAT family N-acetyltransferase [Fodinicurvata sediminis]|uniref:GNAT family N-acetyltransferase n=1 Tax=Fodinicurvata sediminis TaxID=1121832 RepID=UPI0003B62361|nr:GNAT family N-acetyltransferase [Fodinicurvata sediminis]
MTSAVSALQAEGLTTRRLEAGDAAIVLALHRRALQAIADPQWVRPEEPGFFSQVLGPEGSGIGAFDSEGNLVAYALIQTELEADDLANLVWDDGRTEGVAKLCGSAVAPEWRGRNLQQALSVERLQLADSLGLDRLFATAAPGNAASWISLIHAGLQIARLGHRYGGRLRYTLVRDEIHPLDETIPELRDLQDLEGQRELLADGWRGVLLVDSDAGGRRLEFRPCP